MQIMRKAFQMFDTTKSGFIETIKIATILNTMGQLFDEVELQNWINEEDPEGNSALTRIRSKMPTNCNILIYCRNPQSEL
jgi:Ca2+-binding EF-hand superfamily protein